MQRLRGTPIPEDIREIAEEMILDHAKDVEYLSIGEKLDYLYDELGEEAFDRLQLAVDKAIQEANVSVTWKD